MLRCAAGSQPKRRKATRGGAAGRVPPGEARAAKKARKVRAQYLVCLRRLWRVRSGSIFPNSSCTDAFAGSIDATASAGMERPRSMLQARFGA